MPLVHSVVYILNAFRFHIALILYAHSLAYIFDASRDYIALIPYAHSPDPTCTNISNTATSRVPVLWFCSHFSYHDCLDICIHFLHIFLVHFSCNNHGQKQFRTSRFLMPLIGSVSMKIQKISDRLKDLRKFFKSRPSRKF